MRWIFRGLLAIFAIVLVAIAAFFLVPAERIADLAAQRFEAATGRSLTIDGDVHPTLWPVLGVTMDGVAVANAPWSQNGPMLRAERLKVGVDAISLFSGTVRITEIVAAKPEILLETGPDGIGNWVFATETEAPQTDGTKSDGSPLRGASLDQAVLRDGRLRILDAGAGVERTLDAVDVDLAIPGVDGRTTFALSALSNGQSVSVEGHIDGLGAFVTQGAVPLDVAIAVGSTSARLVGRGGMVPPAVAGRLTSDLGDLSAPMTALGLDAPGLPEGLGARAIALGGDVTYTDATLNLRDMTLTLDDTTFTGAADLSMAAAVPTLNVKLATPALNLAALTKSDGAGSPGATASTASEWSTDRIDVGALHLMDAKLSLVAETVRLGQTTLGRTDLYTTLEGGRAVTELRELRAYGGRVDGSVVLNARGGLSTRVAVNGSALAISSLLSEFLGFDRLIASGDVTLNVLGVGDSVAALMGSLEGEGRFTTSAGELTGLDLAGMLRTLDLNYVGQGAKTIFDRISGSFTIAQGVLNNDDLALLAPLLSANGAGRVDLGQRTLDYRIEARLLGEDGVRVPVFVRGPWSDAKVRLDLEGLARGNLKDEGRALEEKAKAKVKEKIAEELGVQIGEDERIEDALKTQARSRLLDLLGGN